MTIGTPFTIGLALVGVFFAALYGVLATARLIRVTKVAPLAKSQGPPGPPADDVPTMRFEGEAFEERWQGSRGYERPGGSAPAAGQNWTDRLIIPVLTPLRPSRFDDRSYWRRYLPGVLVVWLFLFVALPLLIGVFVEGGTFSPTAEQRAVPRGGAAYVSTPTACDGPTATPHSTVPGAVKAVPVDYTDDSKVVDVHAGAVVAVTYLYSKPLFSPGVPLCPLPNAVARSGVAFYLAAGSGSGYVYLPQPNGTQVVEIEVRSLLSLPLLVLLVVSLLTVVYDVAVTVRLRRAVRSRYTRTED